MIYQSGYLTIKDYDKEFGNYLLEFPNDEVRYGFINFLVPYYTSMVNDDQGFYIGKFVQELRSGDYNSFLTRLQAFFADFSYELSDKTERHYQVVFYLVFKLMGSFTDAGGSQCPWPCGRCGEDSEIHLRLRVQAERAPPSKPCARSMTKAT